jgi:hypothetical protein
LRVAQHAAAAGATSRCVVGGHGGRRVRDHAPGRDQPGHRCGARMTLGHRRNRSRSSFDNTLGSLASDPRFAEFTIPTAVVRLEFDSKCVESLCGQVAWIRGGNGPVGGGAARHPGGGSAGRGDRCWPGAGRTIQAGVDFIELGGAG